MSLNNNEPNSSKNFIVAMICFMAIMFGYDYFFSSPQNNNQNVETSRNVSDEKDISDQDKLITVSEAMQKGTRIKLENSHIVGSIDLTGGIIDSVILKNYKETTEENSDNVMLLTPKDTEKQFYYAISYVDKTNHDDITNSTLWNVENKKAETQSITLKTTTKSGIIIERTITIDDMYMWRIKDKILNTSDKNIKISAHSELVRQAPEQNNYAVVHEGIVGYYDKKVNEIKYKDIEGSKITKDCRWLGYTDLYWLCSIINTSKKVTVSFDKPDDETYKITTDRRGDITIEPNAMVELNYTLFTGAKDYKVLKDYRDNENFDQFDMAIDFGWFFIITKPLIQLVDILADMFSNMGFVILILTILFRLITYPLMKKSFVSMARMREVQPKIALIQRTYSGDKIRMNQELMLLYKREKISPMSGCLPMLLQAPIFFCLYKVFFISIEMRHAPLFGWIHDLSSPDKLYITNLFGLINWDPPSFLQIGVCPIIMGITMFLQQKLSSSNKTNVTSKTSEQKMQENMMLAMPLIFTYICASFPTAVVIYWTISNVFSIVQQRIVTKQIGRQCVK